MKVLVTGATGFLGGPLVERLLAHGETDIAVTARAGSRRDRIEAAAARHPGARIEYVQANLASPADAARAVEGVQVVYHLAASLRGAPADMFLNTVVASKNLIDAIGTRKPMRVVLVSSFSVYGVAGLPRGTLVDEQTPLEPHPEKRDPYALVKLRQERLFRDAAAAQGFELVVLRPGVIYGPGGSAFSTRVGLNLFGLFLSLGGRNLLPLSYVDNCADAIVVAGRAPGAAGQVYNLHDDGLPTCRQYLRAYRRAVRPIRFVPVPYPALALLSAGIERYHRWSKGQLPAIFTPYKTATAWGGNKFDNSKIKQLGWRQHIPTDEGMTRTFDWLREQATG
jgi:nucleoside-diphosphate-sugar epimerase